jgi:hypothetical protein
VRPHDLWLLDEGRVALGPIARALGADRQLAVAGVAAHGRPRGHGQLRVALAAGRERQRRRREVEANHALVVLAIEAHLRWGVAEVADRHG